MLTNNDPKGKLVFMSAASLIQNKARLEVLGKILRVKNIMDSCLLLYIMVFFLKNEQSRLSPQQLLMPLLIIFNLFAFN